MSKSPSFQTGQTMIFVKNFTVLPSLNSFEKDLDMMFNNVLNGRKAFLELAHDFGQKLETSSQYFFFEKGLDMMFKDVPDGNEIFLDFKNVILIYSKKHFYKEFC